MKSFPRIFFLSLQNPVALPTVQRFKSAAAAAMSEGDGVMIALDADTLPEAPLVGSRRLCFASVLSCLLLACSYVGSLYVWRSDLPRDHPAVIKRRFTSVLIVSALSPVFVWTWREYTGIKVK
uniref:Ras converting CAAX endopeptidase 1 n=1 Tax=Erpetoichthys calabaricus TaxID=27687 RepID=A0A8C4RI80_ERPCA